MAGILKVDRVQSDSNLAFQVGSSNVAFFSATDGLTLPNTIIGANGFKFPASQISSSDANTLDDYEEGTWNPTLTYSTTLTQTSGPWQTKSLGASRGQYIKIGKLVYFTTYATYSDVGSEYIAINISLPFQVGTIEAAAYTAAYNMKSRYSTTIPTNLTQDSIISASSTYVNTVWSAFADGGSFSWFWNVNSYCYWSGSYIAAA